MADIGHRRNGTQGHMRNCSAIISKQEEKKLALFIEYIL